MDGILEGPTNQEPFRTATKNLLKKLSGSWTSLAIDRVGHHTVTKLFTSLPVEDKLLLASELVREKNRLGGNSIGRVVMDTCALHKLVESEDAWREALAKQAEKEKFLEEILGGINISAADKRRKRKRKRHGKVSDLADERIHEDKKACVVESIMKTISTASQSIYRKPGSESVRGNAMK